MRKVIVVATGAYRHCLPSVLLNIYYGDRQPKVNEPVIVTTKNDEVLADKARVTYVNDQSKTYDVRVW